MKKTGLLVLSLVLALGALGIGYAAWSQTLTVTGNVNTGSYIVTMTSPTPSPTDVSKTAWVTVDAHNNYSCTLSVHNGYPGFVGTATFDIENTGSVPAKLTTVKLTEADGTTLVDPWNGGVRSFHLTTPSTANDVSVEYASSPSLPTIGTGNLTKDQAYGITVTVKVLNTLTGTTDAGGMDGIFTIEFVTDQNPAS